MNPRVYNQQNYLPVNECGVITIYPMTVNCIPIPPLFPSGKGSLTLQIVGGTPPYSINLLNFTGNVIISNSNLANIPNLLPGTYFVEITDSFGDFQQVINCTIPEPTTTTTTTSSLPIIVPSYQEYSMCMNINLKRVVGTISYPYSDSISFLLYSFTNVSGITTPIFISNSGEELIIWDNNINNWSLSASSSSTLNIYLTGQTFTNWDIINTTSLPSPSIPFTPTNLPLGPWYLIPSSGLPPTPPITGTINALFGICKQPTLFLFINESWWQYYGANIPSQYRGSSCGGNNKTPWFKWSTQNLGGVTVTDYEILCTNNGTGNIYFDVTSIDSTQFQISDTIPWIGSPTINPTTGGGIVNSKGWEGPCLPPLTNQNFTVTLTANLSVGGPLTASINFIYCQTVTNGICGI
jgi:hypothetical protein